MVYTDPMGRTNIQLNDELVERAKELYGVKTKKDAVDLALRRLVGKPMSKDEALALRGSGWDADLADLRKTDQPERL